MVLQNASVYLIPVPNALAEALMRSKLSGGQCRLILWVLRNTLGWNRASTRVTWYRIAKDLGMSRSSTLRAARQLIEFSVLLLKDAQLRMDPAKRYQSMNEVSVELAAVSGGERLVSLEPKSTFSQPARSLEHKQAKAAVGRMNYESLVQSRRAAEELGELLKMNASDGLRSLVMRELRDLMLSVPRSRSGSVAGAVREIRKVALELLRQASDKDLRVCFRPKDFQHLDLWNMNFSDLNLAGFSFTHCFLIESSFEGCNLRGVAFSEAWIRNVNFFGADLSGADLTDADWFNAIGLTEEQLATVRAETLSECPANEAQLRDHLDDRYGFPIGSWPDQVRVAWTAAKPADIAIAGAVRTIWCLMVLSNV